MPRNPKETHQAQVVTLGPAKPLGETSQAQETPQPATKSPFSIEALRLDQNFDQAVGVQKLLTTVPVRKPGRQEFVRVRPGAEWQLDTALLLFKEDDETYLVAPHLWSEIYDDMTFRRLVLAISRRGTLFLWPLSLPTSDGRHTGWSRSALRAAEEAEKRWTKLQGNRGLGAYEIFLGSEDLPPPAWPEHTFQQILDIAFKDYRIEDLDHPAIQRLHGKL